MNVEKKYVARDELRQHDKRYHALLHFLLLPAASRLRG